MKAAEQATRAARWLSSRFVPGGAILLYHRIASTGSQTANDPFRLCVPRDQFAEHLEAIRELLRPVRLSEIVDATRAGTRRKPPVAITFDDGYADNLHVAKPLLERFEIPATVFVVSGSVGERFWWDELTHYLLVPQKLPERLELPIDGKVESWQVDCRQIASRSRLLGCVYRVLQPLEPGKRRVLLDRLRDWSGSARGDSGPERAMTPEEVRELTADGLIEVGAHTVSHCRLAVLRRSEQNAEIAQSKAALEAMTGRPVTSFAYPYGRRQDYSPDSVECVRQQRFAVACTNVVDVVRPTSDPHELPRLWVTPSSGRGLESRLRRWLPL